MFFDTVEILGYIPGPNIVVGSTRTAIGTTAIAIGGITVVVSMVALSVFSTLSSKTVDRLLGDAAWGANAIIWGGLQTFEGIAELLLFGKLIIKIDQIRRKAENCWELSIY